MVYAGCEWCACCAWGFGMVCGGCKSCAKVGGIKEKPSLDMSRERGSFCVRACGMIKGGAQRGT